MCDPFDLILYTFETSRTSAVSMTSFMMVDVLLRVRRDMQCLDSEHRIDEGRFSGMKMSLRCMEAFFGISTITILLVSFLSCNCCPVLCIEQHSFIRILPDFIGIDIAQTPISFLISRSFLLDTRFTKPFSQNSKNFFKGHPLNPQICRSRILPRTILSPVC